MKIEPLPPTDVKAQIELTLEDARLLHAATRPGRNTQAQIDLLRQFGDMLNAAAGGALGEHQLDVELDECGDA